MRVLCGLECRWFLVGILRDVPGDRAHGALAEASVSRDIQCWHCEQPIGKHEPVWRIEQNGRTQGVVHYLAQHCGKRLWSQTWEEVADYYNSTGDVMSDAPVVTGPWFWKRGVFMAPAK